MHTHTHTHTHVHTLATPPYTYPHTATGSLSHRIWTRNESRKRENPEEKTLAVLPSPG